MRILITGFEPFGQHATNPSGELALALGGTVLPVSAGALGPALETAVAAARPDLVLALGLAEKRTELSVERVGINVLDFRLPDNEGDQPAGEPIVPDAPAAYFSSLPLRAIEAAWKREGIPGSVSNSAGTFCCNQLLYLIRHRGLEGGFIHLPPTEVVAAAVQRRGVELAREVIGSLTRLPA